MTEDSEVRPQIETLLKRYETALNSSDLDAIMNLVVADPVFILANMPATTDGNRFRENTAETFKHVKFNHHFTLQEVETSGKLAWGRTTTATRTRNLDSGKEIEGGSNQLWVFQREDGGWKVRSYMAASDRPPAPSLSARHQT